MDKFLMMSMLYDFYGELLTDKQKSVFEMYYLSDFSLNEIGEQFDITKQAVRDMLKRTEAILMNYEKKLLLVNRYLNQKEKLNNVISKLDDFAANFEAEELNELKSLVADVLN